MMKCLLTCGFVAAATSSVVAEPVKIGLITTLSGGGASLGVDARDGFLLAIKHAGRKDVQIVIQDDAMKPDLAVQAADRMIQSEKVDVLSGIIWSNVLLAVVPNVMSQGKIYISSNAGPSQLAGAGCNPNYFNAAYQNDNFHEGMGEYAQTQGLKNVFILAPNYPAGIDALKGFKRFYKGQLAGEVYTKLGQTDYAAEIAQLRNSGAEAVFFFLPGAMGISFVKQYAQSGIGVPLMGPGFSFSQDVLGAIGDAALGARNSASWAKDLGNAANSKFVEGFRSEYRRLPGIYAALAYDTANLVIAASAKTSPKDINAFRSALKAADFESVRGKFKFNSNNHPVQDIHVAEVVREEGVLTNRLVGKALSDRGDAYTSECKM